MATTEQTRPNPSDEPKADCPYQRRGFKNRTEYLRSLADEYDADFVLVTVVADVYGPSEDFDGLINALEDGDCNFPF